jgi:prophage regulatory protein
MNNLKINEVTQQVLFITDLEKMIGRNRLTLRRWWTEGKFPRPVKLNETTLAWRTSTINEWLNQTLKH